MKASECVVAPGQIWKCGNDLYTIKKVNLDKKPNDAEVTFSEHQGSRHHPRMFASQICGSSDWERVS